MSYVATVKVFEKFYISYVKSAKIIVTNKEKLEMQQCLSVGVLGLPSPHLDSPELDTPSSL